MKARNGTIDFLKFIFSVIILMFHGFLYLQDGQQAHLTNGAKPVEFFFLMSGYLMAASASKIPQGDIGTHTFQFMKKKVAGLLPNYYVAFCLAFCAIGYFSFESLNDVVHHLIQSIPELLFITQTGIVWQYFNDPVWYISAMLLSMLIIYPLILKYRNTFYYVIAPVIFLTIVGMLFAEYGKLAKPFEPGPFGIIRGLYRGFFEITGGCMCYKAAESLKQFRFTKPMTIFFAIAEWSLYLAAILYMEYSSASSYDFVLVFVLMIAITLTASQVNPFDRIFDKKVFYWLGEYSFSLYLGHFFLIRVRKDLFPSAWGFSKVFFVYLIVAICLGLFIHYVSKGLRLWFAKNKNKIEGMVLIRK